MRIHNDGVLVCHTPLIPHLIALAVYHHLALSIPQTGIKFLGLNHILPGAN